MNPFSSHRVRPGAIPFFFPLGRSAAEMAEQLARNRWRGQIIGGHGSGKSTMLCALLPHVERRGAAIRHGAFHGGRFAWREDAPPQEENRAAGRRLVVIDGFERLSVFARLYWKIRCRLLGEGLLVTAHREMGLPTLYRTEITQEIARRVVDRLLAACPSEIRLDAGDVQRALAEHPGDLRSALFALYDVCESRRR